MKRIFTIVAIAFTLLTASAQETTVDFEDFGLSPGSFMNGSDGTSSFNTDYFSLPINYDDTYNSWTGWALSSMTDTMTPGVGNQYSAITGSGVNGSITYATSYNFVPNELQMFSPIGGTDFAPNGIYITNATYPYFSMLNGDMFAKKFGGVDGTDPDFFLLTIKGVNGEGQPESVDFYLADYRFDDNSEDYIIDKWTFVDLSKFASYENLQFHLTSSDSGVYGVNTPQYFCIDNFIFDVTTSTEDESFANLNVFPNPANDMLNIALEGNGQYKILNNTGKILLSNSLQNNQIDISTLSSGVYNIIITTDNGNTTTRFVKI
ncbi:MAG: hypothetical protein ACJA1A_000310 [Saprospiraceae bacterium]|jgi:hypothetical protein